MNFLLVTGIVVVAVLQIITIKILLRSTSAILKLLNAPGQLKKISFLFGKK